MRIFLRLLTAIVLSALTVQAYSVVEVYDDEGTQITLAIPAQRIVSLAPSLTELIYSAGAGENLVGVVEHSDFPAAAKALPIVGRFDLLDIERILELDPDLVVAWQTGNPRSSVNQLRQLGLTVYVAEPRSLAAIPSHIERLAVLVGKELSDLKVIYDFQQKLEALNSKYRHQSPVTIFYQVWDRPLITAGGNELINDIITLCGGRNIFANIRRVAPKVSREAVLKRNPEVIIASGMDIERPEWLDDWLRWPSLKAVANKNLFFVPPDLLQRHTPRALLGAAQICDQLDQARSNSH
ncbi:MAG: cobalamin-binding protein [Pseudomonadota bacterium]|nr:cobalamin-binding protein [Pseudomonadota bacterium]